MAKAIQISDKLQKELEKRKIFDRETYEEVIWDFLEDSMELSEETKRRIKVAEKEFKEGKIVSLEEIKRKLKL